MAIVEGAEAGQRAVARGANALQVRIRGGPGQVLYVEARALAVSCTVPVLVSSRVDVALAADTLGVNLPAADISVRDARRLLGDDRLLGRSVHSAEEAGSAEAQGADFIIFGPVFATPTHPEAAPAGLEALREVAAAVSIPVIAIGGIDERRAHECRRAGASGVAGIRMFA